MLSFSSKPVLIINIGLVFLTFLLCLFSLAKFIVVVYKTKVFSFQCLFHVTIIVSSIFRIVYIVIYDNQIYKLSPLKLMLWLTPFVLFSLTFVKLSHSLYHFYGIISRMSNQKLRKNKRILSICITIFVILWIFGLVIICVTDNKTKATKWVKRGLAIFFLVIIYISILLMDFVSWKINKKFQTNKNFRRLFYILLITSVLFLVRVPWMIMLFRYEKMYKYDTNQKLEWTIIYFCCSILSELLPNFLIMLFVFGNPKPNFERTVFKKKNIEYDVISDNSSDEI
ncbi:hypothetical protein M0813_28074 [Anaeramoeba flamelloides]|uniref:G-protein coupled receptors family 1 profile domain-containing protein n=1 Tax=Anaeramoeba flamelloides TaxID=1746091 RepID=A0AAV7YH72_9EUKA|nr:hypothetical protein M0812_25577 [Anaeramoeba flamelloides]KAJ6236153.1 hypothetical protein M0813_28074 [Anaeramoeba flamelloides]